MDGVRVFDFTHNESVMNGDIGGLVKSGEIDGLETDGEIDVLETNGTLQTATVRRYPRRSLVAIGSVVPSPVH